MQRILLCLFACLAVAFAAEARDRRAFVVGVESYAELPTLDTTVRDARALEAVLRSDLGFDHVTYDPGTSLLDFKLAFGAFIESIEPGDDVVFYFSGHGWSDGFENYLAFGDARKSAPQATLRLTTLNLTKEVLDMIAGQEPGALVLIIDACRNNPFSGVTKSLTKGLVRIPEREGTLIAFAAGQGQEALARLPGEEGPQLSLFSRELLPRLKDARKPLARILEDTRKSVQSIASAVPHEQRPAVYSELPLDYCFSRNCVSAFDEEDTYWLQVSAANETVAACAGYARYLERYPQGKYAGRALLESKQPACTNDPASEFIPDAPNAACTALQAVVYFDFDRTNLNASSLDVLDALLRPDPACRVEAITISGHDASAYVIEDVAASPSYSMAVSQRRASTVRDYLVSQGADASRIITEAFGAAKLAVNVQGKEPLNRRVEITVLRQTFQQ